MSHLTTLIKRIKYMESKKADPKSSLFQGRLMNIAEYLVYYNDYTKEEAEEAVKILKKYGFNVDLTPQGIERKLIELRGLPDCYSDTCMRCGRPLSNPYSKKKGLGPVCRAKVKRGDWRDDMDVLEKRSVGVKKLNEFGLDRHI